MLNTAQNLIKRKLKKPVLVVIGLYVLITSALYMMQEQFLFLPTALNQDYKYQFTHNFEELNFKMNDGAKLNAIHFKLENPKGVILYFHGNSGNLSRWGNVAEDFVYRGYDVLIMDYRTYGKSTGELSEQAFYRDAQYCYDYLLKYYTSDKITIYGRSLGTGLASYVASKTSPKQLILETPYYSITDVAKDRFPIFPVTLLLNYKFPSFSFLEQVSCPVVIFHGTEDTVVPFSSAKKLYEATKQNQVKFVEIEGGNHNNLASFKIFQTELNNALD